MLSGLLVSSRCHPDSETRGDGAENDVDGFLCVGGQSCSSCFIVEGNGLLYCLSVQQHLVSFLKFVRNGHR